MGSGVFTFEVLYIYVWVCVCVCVCVFVVVWLWSVGSGCVVVRCPGQFCYLLPLLPLPVCCQPHHHPGHSRHANRLSGLSGCCQGEQVLAAKCEYKWTHRHTHFWISVVQENCISELWLPLPFLFLKSSLLNLSRQSYEMTNQYVANPSVSVSACCGLFKL